MWEALIIILALGGLEAALWWISEKRQRREMAEQTELLESIAVSLSLQEENGQESKVHK